MREPLVWETSAVTTTARRHKGNDDDDDGGKTCAMFLRFFIVVILHWLLGFYACPQDVLDRASPPTLLVSPYLVFAYFLPSQERLQESFKYSTIVCAGLVR